MGWSSASKSSRGCVVRTEKCDKTIHAQRNTSGGDAGIVEESKVYEPRDPRIRQFHSECRIFPRRSAGIRKDENAVPRAMLLYVAGWDPVQRGSYDTLIRSRGARGGGVTPSTVMLLSGTSASRLAGVPGTRTQILSLRTTTITQSFLNGIGQLESRGDAIRSKPSLM